MQSSFLQVLVSRSLVAPGDRVLVAVSGGADSVALLHLLHSAAPSFPVSLLVAHLDHGLRPESGGDEAFVRALCHRLGLPLASRREDVAALARRRGIGVEEAGRDARRAFFEEAAQDQGCRVIALGHHRGDQAETIIHRLVRGTGLSGLAGMDFRSGPYIRPLLPFTREELRSYLALHGLPHVEDASNSDPAFARNRIRHQILPTMALINPAAESQLVRLAQQIALEEDFWEGEVARVLKTLARRDPDGLRLDCQGLGRLHPALRLRVIRRALGELRGDLLGLGRVHFEAVVGLAEGRRPQGEVHLPGAWVGRRYGSLWLRRSPPVKGEPFVLEMPGPGTYPLPCGGELSVVLAESALGEDRGSVEFDAGRVVFPLRVRTFLDGDRFHPSGAPGGKKLKDFFIDRKVSKEKRATVPLVVGGEILWVVGLRRCQGLRPVEGGAGVLRMVLRGGDCQSIDL